MSRLDLGCGCVPTGDVNVDYFIKDVGHRTGKANVLAGNVPVHIGQFVKWDLNTLPLPFASNSFDEVYCSHTIEHVKQPFKLLSEMVRISSYKVIVKCPHRLGERATLRKNPFHLSFFGVGWFHKAAKKLNCTALIKITEHRYLPHEFMPILRLPYEMTITMIKSDLIE